jgi:hypothetical protein
MTVYCGGLLTRDSAETIALFKRLAALAGTRGVYTEDLSAMELRP